MKIAIMQPYLFPYIGYFQLMNAVDRFIIYDDVSFIKGGWINRNYIAGNGGPLLYSVPLRNASSYKRIRETEVDTSSYTKWRSKFLQTLTHHYKGAPFFNTVFPSLQSIFGKDVVCLKDLLLDGLAYVADYLQLSTQLVPSSVIYGNDSLRSQERVIDICRQEGATDYYNLMGGKALYDAAAFARSSIRLHFVQPAGDIIYKQGNARDFIPRLSMIDVLMYNEPGVISAYLEQYETA